jgi:hypothetical protein
MGDYSGWAINRSNKFNVKITICRIVALGGFAADPGINFRAKNMNSYLRKSLYGCTFQAIEIARRN